MMTKSERVTDRRPVLLHKGIRRCGGSLTSYASLHVCMGWQRGGLIARLFVMYARVRTYTHPHIHISIYVHTPIHHRMPCCQPSAKNNDEDVDDDFDDDDDPTTSKMVSVCRVQQVSFQSTSIYIYVCMCGPPSCACSDRHVCMCLQRARPAQGAAERVGSALLAGTTDRVLLHDGQLLWQRQFVRLYDVAAAAMQWQQGRQQWLAAAMAMTTWHMCSLQARIHEAPSVACRSS